jgi:hypothetical protein
MDINKLTPAEVDSLINSAKMMLDKYPTDMPLGKIDDQFDLCDDSNGIDYKFRRYRHPIDDTRFSISIRIKNNNAFLVRLDIQNGTHKNPDGTKIAQNHIHIYDNGGGPRKDDYARPLPPVFNGRVYSIFKAIEVFFMEYKVTII